MVEKARTFLMSFCEQAMVAATKAVTPPTTAIVVRPGTESASTGDMRQSRYTPAVTMVAAWMRAETGVGPSIASGSQLKSGIWALLPVAPSNRVSTTNVATVGVSDPALAKMLKYVSVCKREKSRNIATNMPTSPTRL